jgi:hypothetical protein
MVKSIVSATLVGPLVTTHHLVPPVLLVLLALLAAAVPLLDHLRCLSLANSLRADILHPPCQGKDCALVPVSLLGAEEDVSPNDEPPSS